MKSDGDDDDDRALPAINAKGEAWPREDRRDPALHRAAAALFGSLADQEDGRARHRPAVDLCIDAATLRDREYVVDRQEAVPEAKGRLVTHSWRTSSNATSNSASRPRSRKSSTEISAGEARLEGRAARFLARVPRHVDETKELRITDVLDALNERWSRWSSAARRRLRPAHLPEMRHRQASLKLGKYGSFVGCSNYPECNFTRQLSARRPDGEAATCPNEPKVLGTDPYTEDEITLRTGPLRPLCAARRRQGSQALQPAEGLEGRGYRPREGAGAAQRCRAMSASIPNPAR
jgi:DNA topoisomerase-1